MKNLQITRLKFIGKSLLWASLLYTVFITVFNISEVKHKKNEPVSYTHTSPKQTIPLHISVDSFQKKINITGSNIIHYLLKQI